MRVTDGKLPFVSLDNVDRSSVLPSGLAACFGRPCVFETTIALLPRNVNHSGGHARGMLDLEEQNLRVLGNDKVHYLSYPPSFAVDGKPETAFRSLLSIFILFHWVSPFSLFNRCSTG
jgi:hypothetical protein